MSGTLPGTCAVAPAASVASATVSAHRTPGRRITLIRLTAELGQHAGIALLRARRARRLPSYNTVDRCAQPAASSVAKIPATSAPGVASSARATKAEAFATEKLI